MTLISSAHRTVPVTVQARSACAPADVFDAVAPIDLPTIFRPWGPFPGVARVLGQTGPWDRTGATRTPQLTDGTSVTETLTEYVRGHSFAYELVDFGNVLGRLVLGVRGEWTFTPDGAGTVLRWTYEFAPRRGCRLAVRGGLALPWQRYMQGCLTRAVHVVATSQAGHRA